MKILCLSLGIHSSFITNAFNLIFDQTVCCRCRFRQALARHDCTYIPYILYTIYLMDVYSLDFDQLAAEQQLLGPQLRYGYGQIVIVYHNERIVAHPLPAAKKIEKK